MEKVLEGKKVAVLVETEYIPSEIKFYKEFFKRVGAEVHLMTYLWGEKSRVLVGDVTEADKVLENITVNMDIKDANPNDYAIVLTAANYVACRLREIPPMGSLGSKDVVTSPVAVRFMASAMMNPQIVKGALCHALWILTPVPELLKGRKVITVWLESHLENDLMKYWNKDCAKEFQGGLFPTYRTNKGEILSKDKDKWPEEFKEAIKSEDTKGLIDTEHNYVRAHLRQTYAYGITFHMTGKVEYLNLCRKGALALVHTFDGNYGMYTVQNVETEEWGPMRKERISQDLAYGLTGLGMYYFIGRFYSERYEFFWGVGSTSSNQTLGTNHTGFRHSVKTFWGILKIGQILEDPYYINFARPKIERILEDAYIESTGSWGRRFDEKGKLEEDKEWWILAELDQACEILALNDPSYLEYLNNTQRYWIDKMVDHEYGEIWHMVSAIDDKPIIKYPKVHSWKTSLHSFGHALFG